MMQQILVYIAVAVSVVFLIKKFFGNKKPKKGCGTDNCGCD
ncbi:attachment p12 family protein [Flavobacterium croceum DSM 17960]|uniref:Attachment p12 family protein n=1 Tax=Flavobacterium croceum DSM 17960 TaxID=1121886 RepID=A0A2S4N8B2_9FLAO|nr:attachment p12 family protein [Flavobacterium croceum DSM 17960]